MPVKTKKVPKVESVTAPSYDIRSREIRRPPRDWSDFMECWQTARTFYEMLGLLENGFNVEPTKCLEFYFGNADGWVNVSNFRLEGREDVMYRVGYDKHGDNLYKTESDLRQELARKAFDMLCANFFSRELDIAQMVECENTLLTIQTFFRVEGDGIGGFHIRNLLYHKNRMSDNERQAVGFLVKLAKYLWKWEEMGILDWQSDDEQEAVWAQNIVTRKRIDAAKSWMIEVLILLDEIRSLHRRDLVLGLNEQCLSKLKEMAMRSELSYHDYVVLKNRRVATLNEACYAGSTAAWLLKEHELITAEHARLTAIRDAEQEMEMLTKKVEVLKTKF